MKKTVEELIDMYRAGKLKTEQSTQRGFIYNDIDANPQPEDGPIKKSGAVIKSILEDHIQLPALYFWSVQDDDEGIHYASDEFNIHDGKQRFLSIEGFTSGIVTTRLDGVEYLFSNLTPEQQERLLNYEFDIVVRQGTLREEEKSFFLINTSGEPLTSYEGLRGAYHGKFIEEFENYIDNCPYDAIKTVGRGQQAIWLLYMALDIIFNDKRTNLADKKYLLSKAKDTLIKIRNNSFDPKYKKFDEKLKLYAELIKQGVAGKNIDKNPQKMCCIASYVIEHRYDDSKVLAYYYTGLRKDNDIERWKFDEHKIAIDNLILNSIECDYRRFFSPTIKSDLYNRSPKCAVCGNRFSFNELEVDHIKPWSKGGRTDQANAQLLCKSCNSSKGNNI